MGRVAIVTDSTVGLSAKELQDLGVMVIPLNVHWGDETYKDGETLDGLTFYRWLQERKDFPKTSQPSAGEFMKFFTAVAERYQPDSILGIFISSGLSGTVSSATLARQGLPDLKIEVLDSQTVAGGAALVVLAAARLAQAGASQDEILEQIRVVQANSHVMFAVDTLEYLHRGGRIGGAARFFGTALSLKPILEIRDGRVESLEKVRLRRKSLERMVEISESRLQGKTPVELVIMHTGMDADTEFFTALVKDRLKPQSCVPSLITPVVGSHTGPGTLGLAFYAL